MRVARMTAELEGVVEMAGLTKDEVKAAAKEAIKEWMDDKFMAFGYWSAYGIAVAALGALTYFIFKFKH